VTVGGGLVVWWLTRPPPPPPPPPPPEPEPVVTCTETLVGQSTASCRMDIEGPGLLRISLRPNPGPSAWRLGVSGLTALTSSCEFIGDIDQPMPTSLRARGPVTLNCPIPGSVRKNAHDIAFTLNTDITNLALSIRVNFEG
jgi:hypothetical protein